MRTLLLGLTLLLASCSSITAQADYDPATDFGAYRTVSLLPPPQEVPAGLPWYSPLRGEQINRRLAEGLAARGLREVPQGEGDLELSFHWTAEPRRELRYTGGPGPYTYGYYGYGHYGPAWHGGVVFGPSWYGPPGYWSHVHDVPYVVGTLVVDAFERESGQLVWHAWSSARFDGDDAKQNCEAMGEAIVERWPGG